MVISCKTSRSGVWLLKLYNHHRYQTTTEHKENSFLLLFFFWASTMRKTHAKRISKSKLNSWMLMSLTHLLFSNYWKQRSYSCIFPQESCLSHLPCNLIYLEQDIVWTIETNEPERESSKQIKIKRQKWYRWLTSEQKKWPTFINGKLSRKALTINKLRLSIKA